MKIGILGTGMVGVALANKALALGHDVMMGARLASNEKAAAWALAGGAQALSGDMADTAAFGDIVIFAVQGASLIEAAEMAGAQNLVGKTVIDVTNPLDFSRGMSPSLIPNMSNTTSAAEVLQATLPGAHVVKTLNTMNASIMVEPDLVAGDHDVFVSGDDANAKEQVVALLQSFGWAKPIDLGGLSTARGTEAMILFWVSMWGKAGHATFNYKIVGA